MSELSEILRKEYKKKEKKKPIDFSMLMEMVEQLYDAIEPEVMGEVDLEEMALSKVTPEMYGTITHASELIDDVETNVELKGKQQIYSLASLTRQHYGGELSDLYEFFPKEGYPGNTMPRPENLKELIEKPELMTAANEIFWVAYSKSKKSNDGEKLEDAFVEYCNFIVPDSAKSISGAGQDILIGNVHCEVKSSQKDAPNYQLNSSAIHPDPGKAYIFMMKSRSDEPNFVIVSSELLYNSALHYYLDHEDGLEQSISNEVKKIMGSVDLADMITKTIISGKPEYEIPKTFRLANSPLVVRFRIMFSLGKYK